MGWDAPPRREIDALREGLKPVHSAHAVLVVLVLSAACARRPVAPQGDVRPAVVHEPSLPVEARGEAGGEPLLILGAIGADDLGGDAELFGFLGLVASPTAVSIEVGRRTGPPTRCASAFGDAPVDRAELAGRCERLGFSVRPSDGPLTCARSPRTAVASGRSLEVCQRVGSVDGEGGALLARSPLRQLETVRALRDGLGDALLLEARREVTRLDGEDRHEMVSLVYRIADPPSIRGRVRALAERLSVDEEALTGLGVRDGPYRVLLLPGDRGGVQLIATTHPPPVDEVDAMLRAPLGD